LLMFTRGTMMKNKMKDILFRAFVISLFLINLKTGHILFFSVGMFLTAIYFLREVNEKKYKK